MRKCVLAERICPCGGLAWRYDLSANAFVCQVDNVSKNSM